jgi:glycosyltransferase involved in cell wall biosynthesis
MRIILVSTFYPPIRPGGCQLRAAELVNYLRIRGHSVWVLTSNYLANQARGEDQIFRVLHLDSDPYFYQPLKFFTSRKRNILKDKKRIIQLIDRVDAQLVVFYCMWNISKSIAYEIEQKYPNRIIYQVSGDWFTAPDAHESYWSLSANHKITKSVKQAISARVVNNLVKERAAHPLQFERVIAVSQQVRSDLVDKVGIPAEHITIINNGIDVKPFLNNKPAYLSNRAGSIQFLCCGPLLENKGFHIAIQAFRKLIDRQSGFEMNMKIVGSGHPNYEKKLHDLVDSLGVSDKIEFVPWVPREEIPQLLMDADIFIFPSRFEAMSRMLQEAMVSGLAVIASRCTSNIEIIQDGINGLFFTPGQIDELAECMEKLVVDQNMRVQLGNEARNTILDRFTIEKMLSQTEEYLKSAIQ